MSAYSAARAAQLGYVQSVGVEVAAQNIQVNLIAQNYVESEDYYPEELLKKESFVQSLSVRCLRVDSVLNERTPFLHYFWRAKKAAFLRDKAFLFLADGRNSENF